MPILNLRKDRKTGEPVRKNLVSAERAKELNYLVIKAYDNKEIEQKGVEEIRD